jgi:hypothetical protein
MKTKILLKRLLPVIILFIAINTGFGIEYALRVPKEWYTSTPAGSYNTLDNPDYNGTSRAMAVDTSQKILYLSAGLKLLIFDIEDKNNPVLLGDFNKTDTAKYIAYQDDVVALAGPTNFNLLDVSDPTNPQNLSVFTIHEYYHTTDIEFIGDYVFLSVAADGTGYGLPNPYYVMYIVDVSDPYNPVETAIFRQFNYYATQLTIDGNIAYLAYDTYGIRTVDISNKSNPILLGSYQAFGLVANLPQMVNVKDTAIRTVDSTRYIMVADGDNGYIIGDMSDPSHPGVIGGVIILEEVVALDVTFSYSFVLTQQGLVYVYSLNKPTKFRIVGKFDAYENSGTAIDIYIHQSTSTMYILRNNGLVIFNLVEGVHNDYYHEEAKLGYTWIAIGLSLIICVPLAISIVMRHHDKFTYSSRF